MDCPWTLLRCPRSHQKTEPILPVSAEAGSYHTKTGRAAREESGRMRWEVKSLPRESRSAAARWSVPAPLVAPAAPEAGGEAERCALRVASALRWASSKQFRIPVAHLARASSEGASRCSARPPAATTLSARDEGRAALCAEKGAPAAFHACFPTKISLTLARLSARSDERVLSPELPSFQ